MGKILCATRGGEESIKTQLFAIEKARTSGDDLVFIYIFDMEFLAHALSGGRPDVIAEEMILMAEFLMTMAVERAERLGVTATFIVRRGKFIEELVEAAKLEEASTVILGRPTSQGHFRMNALESLVESLTQQTGIPFNLGPE